MTVDPAKQAARDSLLAFTQRTFPDFQVAPHHQLIVDYLEAVERGEIRRLIVTMPPRHTKSELCSVRFPAWYLGRHPTRQWIGVSYAAKLAYTFSRQARNLFKDPMWPFDVELAPDSASVQHWETAAGGRYVSAGVGGPVTGAGAHVLAIDDPVKNAEEADSQTFRDNQWEWYTSTARTRLMPGGAIILILTRWNADDLAGRLLAAQEKGGEQWVTLNLPALAEEDDPLGRPEGAALWPAWYNEEALAAIRDGVGPRVWSALYQQRPVPQQGALLKTEWWQYYRELPALDRIIQVWDTAFKTGQSNDYSVCATWGRGRAGYYLIDRWRGKVEYPVLKTMALAQYRQFTPHAVYVEDAASGQSLVQELRQTTRIPIQAFKADRDKVARVNAISDIVAAGRCYLPEDATWLAEFLREHSEFPAGAHDDQVDTTTMALFNLAAGRPVGGAQVMSVPKGGRPEDERPETRPSRAPMMVPKRAR